MKADAQGDANDAAVEIEELLDEAAREHAEGRLQGRAVALDDARTAVTNAENALAQAQADVAAAESAIAQAKAELTEIEGA